MPAPGDHSRVRSSSDTSGTSFQLLYEFELRLSEKMEIQRVQTKEDMKTTVALSVGPILGRLDAIDTRLKAGEDRFLVMDRRISEHSDEIEVNTALLKERERYRAGGATTAIQAAQKDKTDKAGGFISVDKIPSILTAAGILVSTVIGSVALLRNPSVTPATPPATRTVQAP